jgi:hypothetical protein
MEHALHGGDGAECDVLPSMISASISTSPAVLA